MKAALYCRLSEEDKNRGDADSVSIQNQKSMLVSYAETHGWEIYAIYSDDDTRVRTGGVRRSTGS